MLIIFCPREIIDESDVYIDVHKAIRRTNIAPKIRPPARNAESNGNLSSTEEDLIDMNDDKRLHHQFLRRTKTGDFSPKANGVTDSAASLRKNSLLRRASSVTSVGNDGSGKQGPNLDQFKNLGPSNLASRPRQTRYNTVKIKPGGGSLVDNLKIQSQDESTTAISAPKAPQGGVGAGLLNSGGKDASDGVLAVQQGYGTMGSTPPRSAGKSSNGQTAAHHLSPNETIPEEPRPGFDRSNSASTVGSLYSRHSRSTRPITPSMKRGTARSGSITENIVDTGRFRKVVLETTSSSEEHSGSGEGQGQEQAQEHDENDGGVPVEDREERRDKSKEGNSGSGKKKRRRKRRKGGTAKNTEDGEDGPLLDTH